MAIGQDYLHDTLNFREIERIGRLPLSILLVISLAALTNDFFVFSAVFVGSVILLLFSNTKIAPRSPNTLLAVIVLLLISFNTLLVEAQFGITDVLRFSAVLLLVSIRPSYYISVYVLHLTLSLGVVSSVVVVIQFLLPDNTFVRTVTTFYARSDLIEILFDRDMARSVGIFGGPARSGNFIIVSTFSLLILGRMKLLAQPVLVGLMVFFLFSLLLLQAKQAFVCFLLIALGIFGVVRQLMVIVPVVATLVYFGLFESFESLMSRTSSLIARLENYDELVSYLIDSGSIATGVARPADFSVFDSDLIFLFFISGFFGVLLFILLVFSYSKSIAVLLSSSKLLVFFIITISASFNPFLMDSRYGLLVILFFSSVVSLAHTSNSSLLSLNSEFLGKEKHV